MAKRWADNDPSWPERAERLAYRVGSAGMWHASSGARYGDVIEGGEIAEAIRFLLKRAS